MHQTLIYIYLFLAALIAYIIKGIAGFGNSLIMNPLWSFMLVPKQITPVDLLFSMPINAFIVWRDRKNFSLKIVVPLAILLLTGDVIGTFFLQNTGSNILKVILSILVILEAVEFATRPQNVTGNKPNLLFLGIIGVLSGVTAGIFGISVLLVAYISRTTINRGQFRANLGFVFLIDNIFRLFFYLSLKDPILTPSAFRMALIYAPAVILGMFIGIKIDKRISEKTIKKVFVIILLSTGISLLIQNIL